MYLTNWTEHVEPMDIAIMSHCHMRLEIGYQSIWVTWLNEHGKKYVKALYYKNKI